jgi:hypothetical protein
MKANPNGQWHADPAAFDDAGDDSAYARALYGDQVHAGPGTGLGYADPYADPAYAQALYQGAAYVDPDVTDPNLTDSAYARALHAQPVHPYDEPGTDPALPGYGGVEHGEPYPANQGDTDLAYLRSLYRTPPSAGPAYADPDSTGPFYDDRDDVDLAYLGQDRSGGTVLEPRYDDGVYQDGYAYQYDDDDDGSSGDAGYDADETDFFEQEPEEPAVDPRSLPVRRLRRLESSRAASRRGTSLVNGVTLTLAAGIGAATLVAVMAALTGHGLTTRQLFFMTHSTCGIIIVHAFGGGLTTLVMTKESRPKELVRKWSVAVMAVVAWITVLVGTWLGYAGYRAKPRPGSLNLNAYPQQFLLAHKELAFWDTFAMEWKVNSGWITPFLATAVAFVVLRYHRLLLNDLRLRKMLTNLFIIAFAAALLGSMLGAIINVVAPNDFMHRPWQP